jgi:hypothetical protein
VVPIDRGSGPAITTGSLVFPDAGGHLSGMGEEAGVLSGTARVVAKELSA